MKKFRKLIPAFCMLLISAMLMGTSTFAWFSMNNKVTATGMQVQAKAETGIVISNSSKSAWADTATASSASAQLFPTSTADGVTWYHNSSKNADNATDYAGNFETVSTENAQNYYLANKFYIRSASNAELAKDLYVSKVTITAPETANSANLNKAVRVLVKVGGSTFIYCPSDTSTMEYNVNKSETKTKALSAATTTDQKVADVTKIPAAAEGVNPIEVNVYVYFEGEDASCKSTNITATLDELKVSIDFAVKDPAVSP